MIVSMDTIYHHVLVPLIHQSNGDDVGTSEEYFRIQYKRPHYQSNLLISTLLFIKEFARLQIKHFPQCYTAASQEKQTPSSGKAEFSFQHPVTYFFNYCPLLACFLHKRIRLCMYIFYFLLTLTLHGGWLNEAVSLQSVRGCV